MRERVGDTHGEAGMTLRKRHGARARVHFSKDGGSPQKWSNGTGAPAVEAAGERFRAVAAWRVPNNVVASSAKRSRNAAKAPELDDESHWSRAPSASGMAQAPPPACWWRSAVRAHARARVRGATAPVAWTRASASEGEADVDVEGDGEGRLAPSPPSPSPSAPVPVSRRRPRSARQRSRDSASPPVPTSRPDPHAPSLQAQRQHDALFRGLSRQITGLSALGLAGSGRPRALACRHRARARGAPRPSRRRRARLLPRRERAALWAPPRGPRAKVLAVRRRGTQRAHVPADPPRAKKKRRRRNTRPAKAEAEAGAGAGAEARAKAPLWCRTTRRSTATAARRTTIQPRPRTGTRTRPPRGPFRDPPPPPPPAAGIDRSYARTGCGPGMRRVAPRRSARRWRRGIAAPCAARSATPRGSTSERTRRTRGRTRRGGGGGWPRAPGRPRRVPARHGAGTLGGVGVPSLQGARGGHARRFPGSVPRGGVRRRRAGRAVQAERAQPDGAYARRRVEGRRRGHLPAGRRSRGVSHLRGRARGGARGGEGVRGGPASGRAEATARFGLPRRKAGARRLVAAEDPGRRDDPAERALGERVRAVRRARAQGDDVRATGGRGGGRGTRTTRTASRRRAARGRSESRCGIPTMTRVPPETKKAPGGRRGARREERLEA